MSGKFLARVSAISLALILAACGGDDSSTSLAGVDGNGSSDDGTGGGDTTAGGSAQESVIALGSGAGSSFVEGQIGAASRQLQSGGSTILNVSVVDAANSNELVAGSETSVEFTSRCMSAGDATVNSPAITTSGLIEVEYQAAGCSGQDTVTATTDGATAQVVLEVAPADPRSLIGAVPEPQSIAPVGNASDGRPSSSNVSFTVVDDKGNPVRGVEVTFRLSYSERAPSAVQDVTLDQTSTTSGPSGIATTRVIAGQHNTVVRVVGSITLQSGSTAEVVSPPISINSFLPDQDSFTMGADRYAPNAQFHNNETVTFTVHGGDRFNNNDLESGSAVINFVTTGGSIDNYCILDSDGICTVTWRSSNPRPGSGRISVLARTVGDESFNDLNSNDAFENGEFTPPPGIVFEKGEAYLDVNTNGTFDAGIDQFFDYNGNSAYDGPDGIYDGSACIDPDAMACTAGPTAIWTSKHLLMASDEGLETTLASGVFANQYCVTTSGRTGTGQQLPLPSGTSIEFSIEDGGFISQTTSFIVDDGYNKGSETVQCVYAEEDDDPGTTARLKVLVTPPAPYGGAPAEAFLSF